MYGRLIFNAALDDRRTPSYHMRDNEYAVVLFNTSSQVMKTINERRDINKLIDEILETAASGFTNITAGLHDGREQMKPRPVALQVRHSHHGRECEPSRE